MLPITLTVDGLLTIPIPITYFIFLFLIAITYSSGWLGVPHLAASSPLDLSFQLGMLSCSKRLPRPTLARTQVMPSHQ